VRPDTFCGEAPGVAVFPDRCNPPAWRERATCAVGNAIAIDDRIGLETIDCETAMTTHDVEACLSRDLAWEVARMEVYLKAALEDAHTNLETPAAGIEANPYSAQFIVDLNETQAHWEAYSEQVCSSRGEQFVGGTIGRSMMTGCHIDLTRERTRALWKYSLNGRQGLWPEPIDAVSDEQVLTMSAGRSLATPEAGY
jgi:uncharacterized protein YecT (DUF1311 family)